MENDKILKELHKIADKVKDKKETLFYLYSDGEYGHLEFNGDAMNLSETIYHVLSHGLRQDAKENERTIAEAIVNAISILIKDMDESSFVFSNIINDIYGEVGNKIIQKDVNYN